MTKTFAKSTLPEDPTLNPQLHDLEAERKVLGAMLRNRDAAKTASSLLTGDDFFQPSHGIVFNALRRFIQRDAVYDLTILSDYFHASHELQPIGGEMYLAELAHCVATTVNVEYHTRIVKEKSQRRMMVNLGQEMQSWALEADSIETVISLTQKTMDCFCRHLADREMKKCILSGNELLQWQCPPREDVIAPIVSKGSLNMVYGPRGIGKSFFTLEMALCIALGKPFLDFTVPHPRPVLYVDGEMPMAIQRERLHHLAPNRDIPLLSFLSMEWMQTHMGKSLVLNSPEGQMQLEGIIGRMNPVPEVVVLDNLSSLCRGDENDNAAQDSLLDWLLRLRHKSITVILVHHAGKSGDQRGASRREDPLDTVMKLKRDHGPASGGCTFALEFTKKRNFTYSRTLRCELVEVEDRYSFSFDSESPEKDEQPANQQAEILQWIQQLSITSTKTLAEAAGFSVRRAQILIKKLRQDGYLSDWTVTDRGREMIPSAA